MRYSSDRKQETRARVLKEATKEIRTKGPHDFAVAGVMTRAGLTHGGFYAHFASKEALVAEAIEAMFDDARGRARTFQEIENPRDALRGYFAFYLSPAHRDGRDRGCPLPALTGDVARLTGPGSERFRAGITGLAGLLAGLLSRIGVEDAERQGNALLAQLVGAVSLARALGSGEASDAMLKDTQDQLLALYGLEDR